MNHDNNACEAFIKAKIGKHFVKAPRIEIGEFLSYNVEVLGDSRHQARGPLRLCNISELICCSKRTLKALKNNDSSKINIVDRNH